MFTFKTIGNKDRLEVILDGDLDIDGTEVVDNDLLPLLLKSNRVVINFKDVPFVDSSGMGLFMKIVQTLKEIEINVAVTNIKPDVYEVFELLQIPDIVGKDVFEGSM
ncbi:STAS domain-containing protein [Oceanobacillus damuensis]|uniref:STAS domain-containing protein n=1 Tax=Oceanobacillus damuensis TaxID=937928 RepID=UPI00083315CB|nr:STAS domain-containing protein [Oceanobacillus damuensis]